MRKNHLLLFFLLLSYISVWSQQTNERPVSEFWGLSDEDVPTYVSPALDMNVVAQQDAERAAQGLLEHFSKHVPANLNLSNSGIWQEMPNGDRIWRLRIHAQQALGIVLYYNDFFMPEGGKFFIYTPDRLDMFGAYTGYNNSPDRLFATTLTLSDYIILEYYEPYNVRGLGRVSVSNVSHAYRFTRTRASWAKSAAGGTSGACNVNVICSPEGDNWGDEKRSVVRLLTSATNGSGFCTGALINNARQDCKNYILTANHCSDSDAAADYSQMTIQFNYDATTCNGSTPVSTTNIVTGATFRARSGGAGVAASDFCLFEMNNAIPANYNVYYAGWNRGTTPSPSGVTIHHPSGDLKKITTYTANTQLQSYGGGAGTTHWRGDWVATANGHGITEPGSSGSPLFNNLGQIIGDLSGGPSSCTAANKWDYYGAMSYHWNNNGATANNRRLSVWLDPDNTGATSVNGTYAPCTGFTLTPNPTSVNICLPTGSNTSTIAVAMTGAMTVNLTASGLPSGCTAVFSPASLTASGNSTLTFTNNNAAPGTYTIVVSGNNGTNTTNTNITLNISNGPATTTLTSPANNATGLIPTPILTWTSNPSGGQTYLVEVATDAAFTNIVATANNLTATTYTVTPSLQSSTQYYWRVRASGACGAGVFSVPSIFTTGNTICTNVSATGLPVNITDLNTATSTINFTGNGTVSDVNVLTMVGTHTYISDLTFELRGPNNTTIALLTETCADEDNFSIGFDDQSANAPGSNPCPPTNGLLYRPEAALSVFNGTNAQGNWQLRITDNFNQDVGTLTAWSIRVCYAGSSVSPITATTTRTNVLCFGQSTGSATITATSGTAPYTYQWSNNATTATINNLAAGTYNYTVTDSQGGQATGSVIITQPTAAISATAVVTNAGCNGAATGAINITATGGTAPYSYNWGGGVTTEDRTNLLAGAYTVTITDANNCTFTLTRNVTQASAVSATANIINACNGTNNGFIDIVATGGTTPYTYNWGGGITTEDRPSLAPGSYTVTITDANGCTFSLSNTVGQSSAIVANATATPNYFTAPNCNGSVSVTATGGTAPYFYTWSSGTATTGLCNGTYTVTITDANDCTATTTATVENFVGTNSIPSLTDFNLSPNPNNGQFTLTVGFDKQQDALIEIFAINGQLIMSKSVQALRVNLPIDLSNQASGIYVVRLTTKEGASVLRAMKQ
jgi:subtilisin-like proprotein convertase family protein